MTPGRVAIPTNRSVAAKEAKSRLHLVCIPGLVLTATMTKALIRMITGQISELKIMKANVTCQFLLKYSSSWNRVQYTLGGRAFCMVMFTVEFVG